MWFVFFSPYTLRRSRIFSMKEGTSSYMHAKVARSFSIRDMSRFREDKQATWMGIVLNQMFLDSGSFLEAVI